MTQEESEKEIVIPRLREALTRYQTRQGEFLIDNAITACNNIIAYYDKFGSLTSGKRAFALDLIKNSFAINGGQR